MNFESFEMLQDIADMAETLEAVVPVLLIWVVLSIIAIAVGWWKLFKKSGKAGWKAIVPVYNIITMLQIVGSPFWFAFVILLPVIFSLLKLYILSTVSCVAIQALLILIAVKVSKLFEQSEEMVVGLSILPMVFYPLMAFDKDTKDLVVKEEINSPVAVPTTAPVLEETAVAAPVEQNLDVTPVAEAPVAQAIVQEPIVETPVVEVAPAVQEEPLPVVEPMIQQPDKSPEISIEEVPTIQPVEETSMEVPAAVETPVVAEPETPVLTTLEEPVIQVTEEPSIPVEETPEPVISPIEEVVPVTEEPVAETPIVESAPVAQEVPVPVVEETVVQEPVIEQSAAINIEEPVVEPVINEVVAGLEEQPSTVEPNQQVAEENPVVSEQPVIDETPANLIRFCTNCGSQIMDGSEFCVNCGTKI